MKALLAGALVVCGCHAGVSALDSASQASNGDVAIDRQAVVERHDPSLKRLDPTSPFTLGNGKFAFTADVSGLQSFPELYFREGIPLETKARWAWHSRAYPGHYSLADTFESWPAYGRHVNFPTNMDSPAGQWLRQNPHDLPLARLSFLIDGHAPDATRIGHVNQRLDLWRGILHSRYTLDAEPVTVTTAVHAQRDLVAAAIASPLLASQRLSISIRFPRGYDPAVKNTPAVIMGHADEHVTEIVRRSPQGAVFRQRVDDATHYVRFSWQGKARLEEAAPHEFVLTAAKGETRLAAALEFSPSPFESPNAPPFDDTIESSTRSWEAFWRSGAAIDFSGSTDPRAAELERRVVLSRYLLAAQARAAIPAQETGLTSSSWYGKHHTEMIWWHSAHWLLWGHPDELRRVLDWYVRNLPSARKLAAQRGLRGARWAKMVGPENRESPGGNALIIWNQPQPIQLAEMLYRLDAGGNALSRYSRLVEDSARAMSSMLSFDESSGRWSLDPPIWIAQEIYDPREARNPGFELAYWRTGLEIAQEWRKRLGKAPDPLSAAQLEKLAALPRKDGKYVAIESVPDTFDNIAHRRDHPTMLAAFGLLNDETVDRAVMNRTLDAVLSSWDWETRIWGWDYPMIAMTAARLERPQTAVDILLADAPNNHYLTNGHCPQPGVRLPVYLPANGALLAAVAMMAAGWEGAPARAAPGFPDDGTWTVRTEGLNPLPY